jgi:hypothetical protein
VKTPEKKRVYMVAYHQREHVKAIRAARQKSRYQSLTPDEKAERLAKERAYYHANKQRIIARRRTQADRIRKNARAYVAQNREKYYEYQAASRFKVKRADIIALRASSTVCEVCGAPPNKKRLAIDHCHASGKLRGMLCHSCNLGLGSFRDREDLLIAAAMYLQRKRALTA